MTEEGRPSGRERVHELARRRRRASFLRSLVVFVVVAAGFTVVIVTSWPKFKRTDAYKLLMGETGPAVTEQDHPDLQYEGGFHIVDASYWALFDEIAASGAASVSTPPPDEGDAGGERRPPPAGGGDASGGQPAPPPRDKVHAEGLTVRAMKRTGPYWVNGDMGGLIATRVGIWKSPNRLGNGRIAFYCEHNEKVKITHWAKNLLGFRVYRVIKEGRSGWVLGAALLDENDQSLR
jgi:hypothetical protein